MLTITFIRHGESTDNLVSIEEIGRKTTKLQLLTAPYLGGMERLALV